MAKEDRELMVNQIVQQETDVTDVQDPDRQGEPGAMCALSAAAGTIAEAADLIEAEGWDADTADRVIYLLESALGLVGNAQTDLVEESIGI